MFDVWTYDSFVSGEVGFHILSVHGDESSFITHRITEKSQRNISVQHNSSQFIAAVYQ